MTSWNSSAIGRQCCHCASGVHRRDQNKGRDSASFDYGKTESQISISISPECEEILISLAPALKPGPDRPHAQREQTPGGVKQLRQSFRILAPSYFTGR